MYQAKLSSLLFRRVREMKGPASNDVVDKVDHNTVVLVNFQAYVSCAMFYFSSS